MSSRRLSSLPVSFEHTFTLNICVSYRSTEVSAQLQQNNFSFTVVVQTR